MPYLLVVLSVVARLVPHAWNFTPIGAVGLFAGANYRPAVAWGIPVAAVLISDAIVGFYNPLIMAFVYLGIAAGPLFGRILLRPRRSALRVGSAVTCSATTFFLVSNFGVWLASFPHTVDGLLECYVRGLPYYGVTLLGTAVYAAILFGGQELTQRVSKRSTVRG